MAAVWPSCSGPATRWAASAVDDVAAVATPGSSRCRKARHCAVATGMDNTRRTSPMPTPLAASKFIRTPITTSRWMSRSVSNARASTVTVTAPSIEFSMPTNPMSTWPASTAVSTSGMDGSATSSWPARSACDTSACSVKVPSGPRNPMRREDAGSAAVDMAPDATGAGLGAPKTFARPASSQPLPRRLVRPRLPVVAGEVQTRRRLGRTERQQNQVARLEDRADPLGDHVAGDLVERGEEAGVVAAGLVGERLDPRARGQRRAGLVETDVAVGAYAEELQVDAAGRGDLPLVGGTRGDQVAGLDVRGLHRGVGEIDAGFELAGDERPVRLRVIRREAHVLVEQEGLHLGEAQVTRHVAPGEVAVDDDGRAARGQPEHGGGRGVDQGGDGAAHQDPGLVGTVDDHDLHVPSGSAPRNADGDVARRSWATLPPTTVATTSPPGSSSTTAATAPVTRHSRSPSTRATSATVAGCRCTPSAIAPTRTRSSVSATPTSPGSRWCSGAIALNRCVTHVTPASIAAVACSAVADEWPTETTTPAAVRACTTSRAPGSSGARVTIARPASLVQPSAATSPRSGATRSDGGWAPRRSGARNGPSRWRPSGTANGRSSAASTRAAGGPLRTTSNARARIAAGAVMIVGSQAVTPQRGSAAATSHSRSGSVVRSTPTAPLHCRSTNPGTTRRSAASRTRSPLPATGHSPAAAGASAPTTVSASFAAVGRRAARSAPAPAVPISVGPPGPPPPVPVVRTTEPALTMRPDSMNTSELVHPPAVSTRPPVTTSEPAVTAGRPPPAGAPPRPPPHPPPSPSPPPPPPPPPPRHTSVAAPRSVSIHSVSAWSRNSS